jgi:hypothetical protein
MRPTTVIPLYRNPGFWGEKFRRFGKIVLRSASETPNQLPSVAAY